MFHFNLQFASPGLQVQITLMHIPTIIGAILEGPVVGAFVGMIFGLASLYTATYTPLPVAFAFLNPLVSVLPRILIGIVAHYSYSALNKVNIVNKGHKIEPEVIIKVDEKAIEGNILPLFNDNLVHEVSVELL